MAKLSPKRTKFLPVSSRNKPSFFRFLPEINQVFAGLILLPSQIFSGNEFVATGINQTKNGINGVGNKDDRGDTRDFPGFPANPKLFPVYDPCMVGLYVKKKCRSRSPLA